MFLRLERVCPEADLEGSTPREETFKLKEERQMKTRKSITYLFRGLALGALMIAATGIYFGTTSSGAGNDPSLRSNQVGIAYPSSESSQGLQAPAYWAQRDEVEEMAYDKLSKSFVGIAAPSSQTIEAFRDPS